MSASIAAKTAGESLNNLRKASNVEAAFSADLYAPELRKANLMCAVDDAMKRIVCRTRRGFQQLIGSWKNRSAAVTGNFHLLCRSSSLTFARTRQLTSDAPTDKQLIDVAGS
jgi:hypothetical protein